MKKILIIVEIIAAVGVAFGIYYVNLIHPKSLTLDSETVERQDLTEVVSASGTVKPAENVDLSFERAGRVSAVNVEVGDQVKAGQVLASLDSADLVASLHQAQANLAAQQAQLDNLEKGARPEDIQLQEERVLAAQNSLAQAQRGAIDKIQSAYTLADDAIHNTADQLFFNPRTNPKLAFFLSDPSLESDVETTRLNIEQMFSKWSSSLIGLSLSSDNLSGAIDEATANLNSVKSFLDNVALVVSELSPNAQLMSSTIQSWRTNISLARANVNGGLSALSAASQNLVAAQDGLKVAQGQLIQAKAGATADQIAAQQAQVSSMQAALDAINVQISKTMIRAPFDGIVTKFQPTVGEAISPNVPQISVISGGQFEIEVYVSETDVAKIKVNDPVNVTLDTYGPGEIFGAKVILIDPAATSVNGANAYKVTLQFNDEDNRIKSGMTANVDIVTAQAENVLAAPKQAVITDGSDKYIMIYGANSQPEKRKVEVGISGSNGYVEIVSGVNEGDRIVSFGSNQ